jgi:hypothetical protein
MLLFCKNAMNSEKIATKGNLNIMHPVPGQLQIHKHTYCYWGYIKHKKIL